MPKLFDNPNWMNPTNEGIDDISYSDRKRSIIFTQLCFIGLSG